MMTRLWPAGDPIEVRLAGDGQPEAFLWRGAWHPVAAIANRWEVRASWWSTEAWREYVKLTTTDGLLCVLCRDLYSEAWSCMRLYD